MVDQGMQSDVGARLRNARTAQGLKVRELARKAHLSDTAIHLIEAGSSLPGLPVLEKLANALAVSRNWLAFGDLLDVQIVVAPGFVPSDEFKRYQALTFGPEKFVPEPAKFLDHEGCLAYLSLVSEPSYKAALEGAPLRELSTALIESAGTGPLSLVCLGSGHARYEDRFLNLLLSRVPQLGVVCVDISSALLILGGRRICDTLKSRPTIASTFVFGDFLTMPWETALRPDRRTCLTLFGYTYCNLQDPEGFLRAIPLNRGDLAILDITLAAEPPESDPALQRPPEYQTRLFDFLVGPLMKRHRASELTIQTEIDRQASQYTVRLLASTPVGERYTVGTVKRIDLPSLSAALAPQFTLARVFRYSDGLRAMVLLVRN